MGEIAEAKRQQLNEIMCEAGERIWLLLSDSHEKGRRWEGDLQSFAAAKGLAVEPGYGRGDTKINGLNVQCKHIDATRSGDTLDISNMRPVGANGGHRGYLVGEYDVLALRHHHSIYLIPAQYLDAGDGFLRSRVRLSEIEVFRDAWHVFGVDYTPLRKATQLQLPISNEASDGR